ncbi:MAG: hypothetical protein KDD58_02875 [Bdellovibrionales bacterium]|nr:hypothetical protein [Bdellovibrionales bacterium]
MKAIKKNKGQMVIEMILVMTVLLSLVGLVRSSLQSSEVFKTLVQGPWRVLSGMITSGTWDSPSEAVRWHPAYYDNHGSLRGDDGQ